jgi:hypothetical protein
MHGSNVLPLPQFFDLFFRQIFQFIASKQLECFLEFSDLLLCPQTQLKLSFTCFTVMCSKDIGVDVWETQKV